LIQKAAVRFPCYTFRHTLPQGSQPTGSFSPVLILVMPQQPVALVLPVLTYSLVLGMA